MRRLETEMQREGQACGRGGSYLACTHHLGWVLCFDRCEEQGGRNDEGERENDEGEKVAAKADDANIVTDDEDVLLFSSPSWKRNRNDIRPNRG